MKIKRDFILRQIAGDYVIVPTGQTAINFNGLITVNEAGKFLWEKLQNEVSEDDLVKFMIEKYDVDEDIARSDIQSFIQNMVRGRILE